MTGVEPGGQGRPAELQQEQGRPEQVVREPPGLVPERVVQGRQVQPEQVVQGRRVQQRMQELGLERQVQPEPGTPRRSSRPL